MTGPVVDLIELERLGRLMCTVPEIAKWYNIDQQTVLDFLSRDPFKAAWKKGRLAGMDELRQSAAKVKGKVMMNYVMSGISGLKLNLEYNSSTGRCAAGVDGYSGVVAYLPMNTKDAVLTSNGMLAHRDHNGSISCVMVGNYAEVLEAARKRFEGKGKTDPTTKIDPGKIAINGAFPKDLLTAAKSGMLNDCFISKVETGTIAAHGGYRMEISPDDLVKDSTLRIDQDHLDRSIDAVIHKHMERHVKPLMARISDDAKRMAAMDAKITALESRLAAMGGKVIATEHPAELDRTCTEYGGLAGGSMASYSSNPFVRTKK